MSAMIKIKINTNEIKKEWEQHQLNRDPNFFSRRKFLEQTGFGISAFTFLPTIFSLMTTSQKSQAAQNLNVAAAILSLPGGYSLSAEAPPTTLSGAFLTQASYRTLGVPSPNLTTQVSMKYGAPLHIGGRIFQMLETINPTIQAMGGQIYFAAGWHSNSIDDNTDNPSSPAPHILALANQTGGKFRIQGTQINSNSAAGGRGTSSTNDAIKPAVASTFAQFQDLLTVKKGALASVSTNALIAGASLTQMLTAGAMNRFKAMASGRELAELTQVANSDLVANVSNENPLDPRIDPRLQSAFGITTTTATNDPKMPLAASMKAVIDNLSPLVVAQLQSNFDYHDGTANWNTANGPHAIVADTLKSILLSAAQAKKSIGVFLQTDGATLFARDTQIAQGDAKQIHGAGYFFLAMNNEPLMKQVSLGGMVSNNNAGGSGNTDTNLNILQRNPSYEAHAFVASLLGMQGLKVGDYSPSNISAEEFKALNFFRT